MNRDMTQLAPVRMMEDIPASEKIYFSFDIYAKTLADLMANKENATPIVTAIYGTGGSGKTSLMRVVKKQIEDNPAKDSKCYRLCKTVWFDAWKFDGEEDLLAALIESVIKAMDADGFFSLAKPKIDAIAKRINKSKVFASVSKLSAGEDISEFFSDIAYKEKLGFFDTFQKFFNDLVWTFLNWRFSLDEKTKIDDQKVAMVIFIDNLDRCTHRHIVKVIETISRFMARSGWGFVLNASKETIESAFSEKYGNRRTARSLLEKFVQVNFNLPKIPVQAFGPLIDAAGPDAFILNKHLPILISAIDHNPRRLKRFINTVNILLSLLYGAGVKMTFENILFWAIIGHAYPELAVKIKEHPYNLLVLQKQFKKLNAGKRDKSIGQFTEKQLKEKKIPHALRSYFQRSGFCRIEAFFDIVPEDFIHLHNYCRAVDFYSVISNVNQEAMFSLSDDPMTTVAAGPFLFGENKSAKTINVSFGIDIYPVTYRQYRYFVASGGYSDPSCWSQKGWAWRKACAVAFPAYWDDPRWHKDLHPVIGVSWYEADAYARWTSKKLPTEMQWERAARGTDGWEYPWGHTDDVNRCNTAAAKTNGTTPVDRYSNGISSEGCYDLSGNVWEWTSGRVGRGRQVYIAKGGAWSDTAIHVRAACKKVFRPEFRHPTIGFRCVHIHDDERSKIHNS